MGLLEKKASFKNKIALEFERKILKFIKIQREKFVYLFQNREQQTISILI